MTLTFEPTPDIVRKTSTKNLISAVASARELSLIIRGLVERMEEHLADIDDMLDGCEEDDEEDEDAPAE